MKGQRKSPLGETLVLGSPRLETPRRQLIANRQAATRSPDDNEGLSVHAVIDIEGSSPSTYHYSRSPKPAREGEKLTTQKLPSDGLVGPRPPDGSRTLPLENGALERGALEDRGPAPHHLDPGPGPLPADEGYSKPPVPAPSAPAHPMARPAPRVPAGATSRTAAIVIAGLLLSTVLTGSLLGVWFFWRHTRDTSSERESVQEPPSENEPASSLTTVAGAATSTPDDREATADSAAVPGNEEPTPDSAASSTAARDVSTSDAGPEPTEIVLVRLACQPACAEPTTVTCGGRHAELEEGQLRVPPGDHSCVFRRPGYSSRTVRVRARDGEPPLPVHLVRVPVSASTSTRPPAPPNRPCGTFINPCR